MKENINRLDQVIEETSTGQSQERIRLEVERLANNAGIDPSKIKVEKVALEWSMNCLIVSLHIGRARFERALSHADLGIDTTNNPELTEYINSINLGRQKLVTDQYKELLLKLERLEKQARRVVKNYSIETEFGFAVPCVNRGGVNPFEKLITEIDEIEKEYRETYSSLIYQLDSIKRDTKFFMRSVSHQIYKILKKDEEAIPSEDFVDNFVKKAMLNFPTENHVENTYNFTLSPKFVPLAQTDRELDLVRHNALKLKAEVVESIRANYKEQSQNFVEGILSSLHNILYDTISGSIETLRKTGSLPGSTIHSLRKMIEKVQRLNIPNDQIVLNQVEQLDLMLNKSAKRDPDEVRTLLETLQEENRRFLVMLGNQPRLTRAASDVVQSLPSTQRQSRSVSTEIPKMPLKIRLSR